MQVCDDLKSVFASVLSEYEYWVDSAWVEGKIPVELEGTYFRNGPGHIDNDRHLFDGDGCVLSLAFKGGQAYFRNKFVRTPKFVQEQAAGKPLYRTAFSKGGADGNPLFNPFDLDFVSPANTGVLYWAGQLWALWEGGLPFQLDPLTLNTVGETDLGAKIGGRLAGHYRVTCDPTTGEKRLIMFSAAVSFGGVTIEVYEFDAVGERVAFSSHIVQDVGFTFVHDIVVSDKYYIFILGPLTFDAARFAREYMWGRCSIAQCLKYSEEVGSKVLLFPRPDRPGAASRTSRTMQAPPFFPFHHINAFDVDEEASRIVVDTIGWDEIQFDSDIKGLKPERFVGGERSEYFRLVLDLEANRVDLRRMITRTVEFPTLSSTATGRPHNCVFMVADDVDDDVLWGPAQSLARVNISPSIGSSIPLNSDSIPTTTIEKWKFSSRQFPGEPMFVARAGGCGEDDGWIIVALHDSGRNKADVAIFDARDISAGPLATLHLPHKIPASLHGSFTETYLGPDPSGDTPRWCKPNPIQQL